MTPRQIATFRARRSRSQPSKWVALVLVDQRDRLIFYSDSRERVVELIGWAASLGVPATVCAEARALLEADHAAAEVSIAFR